MAVTGTDETGLAADNNYYFRYNIDGAGYVESNISPDIIIGNQEITEATTVADVSGSLSGKYFTINSTTTEYYVWLNKDSASTDPAPAAKTGIEVLYNENDTADTIASLVSAAIDLSADFSASSNTNLVTITNANKGVVDDALDVDTGFTITTTQQGTADSTATTWDDIITKLNAATATGTWSIYQGDVRLTSDSSGPDAKVRIGNGLSGDNLFTNLIGFTTFDTPKDPYPA